MNILERNVIEPSYDGYQQEDCDIFGYRSYEIADWLLSADQKEIDIELEKPEFKKFYREFAKMYYDFAIELDKKING